MQSTEYDAIVVGSGISGGWAAKELTEKGLRVLLLERGRNVEHIKDYVNATKAPWEYRASRRSHARDGGALPGPQARLPAQREEPRLLGQRARSRRTPRSSASTGIAAITSAAARSCGDARATAGATSTSRRTYATASPSTGRFATRTSRRGTTTSRSTPASPARIEGLPQLPDGQFQPAMPLNCGEELVAGTPDEAVRRQASHHSRPHRQSRRRRSTGRGAVPVPQRVLARLPVRRLLQHAVVDAAGRGEDGTPHAQAVRRS